MEITTSNPALSAELRAHATMSAEDLRDLLNVARDLETSGAMPPDAVALDEPVEVGGLWLYRPTIAAIIVRTRVSDWFDSATRPLVTAYIYAHARNRVVLEAMTTAPVIWAATMLWLEHMTCTQEELLHALAACEAGWPDAVAGRSSSRPPGSWLTVAASAAEEYGGGLDHWLWEESAQRVVWLRHDADRCAPRATGGDRPQAPSVAMVNAQSRWIQITRRLKGTP